VRSNVAVVDLVTASGELFFAVAGLRQSDTHVAIVRDSEIVFYSASARIGNNTAWRLSLGDRGTR
jgi:hypothetical protein